MFSADQMPNGQLGARPTVSFPWAGGPSRLVSMLEMLKFHAPEFIQVSHLLSTIETQWAAFLPRFTSDPTDAGHLNLIDETRDALDVLPGLLEYCKSLELDSAVSQIKRIQEAIEMDINASECAVMLKDLRLRIEDQLQSRLFLFIPAKDALLFSDKEPFGPEVPDKFPEQAYDIIEAAKCLALNRSTATVCHLMRVVEAGVKALAGKLSTTIDIEEVWGRILNQIDAEVKKLETAGMNVETFRGISASLHAVKDAWRNPAMHSRTKYTKEEAEEIFGASRTFMRRLAQII